MFFGTSILEAFWMGFGRVLGSQKPRFSHFFRHCFDAKCGMQLGRAKNRKKSAQDDFIPQFRRSVRPWGEGKRMGGMPSCRPSCMNSWPEILAMLLRNASLELEPCIWHARHPFGRRRMCCAQTAALKEKRKRSR